MRNVLEQLQTRGNVYLGSDVRWGKPQKMGSPFSATYRVPVFDGEEKKAVFVKILPVTAPTTQER